MQRAPTDVYYALKITQGLLSPEINDIEEELRGECKNCKICKQSRLLREYPASEEGVGKSDFCLLCHVDPVGCAEYSKYRGHYDYRGDTAEEVRFKRRIYLDRNRVMLSLNRKKIYKEKRKDLKFRLKMNLRARLYMALKGRLKKMSAVADLGCDIVYFKQHIASQFVEGMSWENYGNKKGCWSLDHIMPLAAFDLENEQHWMLACHYGNIRPLWHADNIRKKDKIFI